MVGDRLSKTEKMSLLNSLIKAADLYKDTDPERAKAYQAQIDQIMSDLGLDVTAGGAGMLPSGEDAFNAILGKTQ